MIQPDIPRLQVGEIRPFDVTILPIQFQPSESPYVSDYGQYMEKMEVHITQSGQRQVNQKEVPVRGVEVEGSPRSQIWQEDREDGSQCRHGRTHSQEIFSTGQRCRQGHT